MRKLAAFALLLAMSTGAWSATGVLICADCRDVREYPKDFGNHAFNETFGQLSSEDFSRYTIYSGQYLVWNPQGQWAMVYMRSESVDAGILASLLRYLSFELAFTTPFVMVRVQDQYGDTTIYSVVFDSPPLIVGSEASAPTTPVPPLLEGIDIPPDLLLDIDILGPDLGVSTSCCNWSGFYFGEGLLGITLPDVDGM